MPVLAEHAFRTILFPYSERWSNLRFIMFHHFQLPFNLRAISRCPNTECFQYRNTILIQYFQMIIWYTANWIWMVSIIFKQKKSPPCNKQSYFHTNHILQPRITLRACTIMNIILTQFGLCMLTSIMRGMKVAQFPRWENQTVLMEQFQTKWSALGYNSQWSP